MTSPSFSPSWNISADIEEEGEPSLKSYFSETQVPQQRTADPTWKQPPLHPQVDRWNAGGYPLKQPSSPSWGMEPPFVLQQQRDTSQHSRGSIWADDRSHASQGTYSSSLPSQSNHGVNALTSSMSLNKGYSIEEAEVGHGIKGRDSQEPTLAHLSYQNPPTSGTQSNPYANTLSRLTSSSSQESQPYLQAVSSNDESSLYARFSSSVSTYSPGHGAFPLYPQSSVSVGSSLPGLVRGCSTSSATSAQGWEGAPSFAPYQQASSPQYQQTATSSLAKAASGNYLLDPPPGFLSRKQGQLDSKQNAGQMSPQHSGTIANNLSSSLGSSVPQRSARRKRRNERSKIGKPQAGRGGNFSSINSPLREHNRGKSSYRDSIAGDASTRSLSSLERAVQGTGTESSLGSSEAIRQLMKGGESYSSYTQATDSTLDPAMLDIEESSSTFQSGPVQEVDSHPILPQQLPDIDDDFNSQTDEEDTFHFDDDDEDVDSWSTVGANSKGVEGSVAVPRSKKKEWLIRMNRKLAETPVGEIDPSSLPLTAIMNAWAKTKSAQGASMVEMWLKRAQEEYDSGNERVSPTTKMYTMAVDAWARSGQGGSAAQRAEALLQHMYKLYQAGGHELLRPTNAIFNAVINAWARSREKIAPVRAEQILNWMENLQELDVQPDKYTFNTVIHAWAKAGGAEAAAKAQELLARMHRMYQEGNILAKPDTISYNVVINAWAKSGGKGAANEAEKLLARMHELFEMGDPDVKPNVVTYGAVIDSFAKSGERDAASRADALLANMIQLHKQDPVRHSDLLPNTYVFNTVINCWAKSKEPDAASKAEEMLVAMGRLHASGMPSLKPDNFTYTAVIDAWAKSGYRGAAARADQLLDKMEAKYMAGDADLKPNSYTYNAVICALAKSGEPGAAARAERVLHNMVNRHRNGGDDDVKPTTINFNTVLDAWAKSGGGRAAADRAEEILEWMDRLHKTGNPDVKVDTISFNAVLDAWARSGDRIAPRRAEQILDHMDELYRAGNKGVKPDRYTYNTLINVWAKSGERGSAARAEHVLSVMEQRFRDGDQDFKPNTRTYTSVIDAWAKSGEKGAARRAEQILNNMISRYETTGDPDVKPNVHTSNAVCNACAFSKHEEDREEALQIAFRVFDWLSNQPDMQPDSYTYTILLSVCANLLPREDSATRFVHARAFFESCRDAGYVNDYVLRKLRQTVSEEEYLGLVEYRTDPSAASMPASWTRNAKLDSRSNSRKGTNNYWSTRRRGK